MPDVDVISAQITVVDNASEALAKVGKASEETAGKFDKLSSRMSRRVEATGAVMMTGALRDLTGAVPGVDAALLLLGRSIQMLFASLGPVGWAVIGVTIAFTTLKKIIDGAAAAQKELAENSGKLASAYENLANQVDEATASSRKYLDTAMALYSAQLAQVNIEKQVLEAKAMRGKLSEKEKLQLLELQAKYDGIAIAIDKIRDKMYGWSAAEKEKAEAAKATAAEQEAMYDEAAKAYIEAIEQMEAMDAEFAEARIALENMVLEQVGSVREIATMKALGDLEKYRKAIEDAAARGMNVSKAQADYQAALEKKTRDYQVKIWAEKYTLLADMAGKSADYLYALGEKLGKAEKVTFEDVTKAYVVLWLDAIEQRLKAEFIAALATANFAKAAMIAAGITALGIVKGALTRESKAAELMAEKIEKPEFPYAELDETKKLTDKAEKVSGKAISTGYSQVVNYVTISPRYELLDASQLSESRIKEIANQIGKYIMEGMATGQYGLQ